MSGIWEVYLWRLRNQSLTCLVIKFKFPLKKPEEFELTYSQAYNICTRLRFWSVCISRAILLRILITCLKAGIVHLYLLVFFLLTYLHLIRAKTFSVRPLKQETKLGHETSLQDTNACTVEFQWFKKLWTMKIVRDRGTSSH